MSRIRWPSVLGLASMVIAITALVYATAGSASAAPTPPGRALLTTATASQSFVANGEQQALNLENATFTQQAGKTVLLITNVTVEFPPTGGNECNVWVAWDNPGPFPDTHIVNLGESFTKFVFGLTPPATSQTYTIEPQVNSEGACPYGEGGANINFTVNAQVAVVAIG